MCSDTATTFVVPGTRPHRKEIEELVSKLLIVKHLATLGPCTALGDATEVMILNRFVRWSNFRTEQDRERIEYEADPRHAELIFQQLGMISSSRIVSTPSENIETWS